MASSNPPILQPVPRRPFERKPLSPSFSTDTSGPPSRANSIRNLTSSTLFGIYSPAYESDRETSSASWGIEAEIPYRSTPSPIYRKRSRSTPRPPQTSQPAVIFSLALRSILLFGTGMLYGLLVRRLHDDRQFAPFQVKDIIRINQNWRYLALWGFAGVGLGSLLPWIDNLWENNISDMESKFGQSCTPEEEAVDTKDSDGIFEADWTPVVRSIGAFVGIAFAIRKLPWTSTMQVSLTLMLVNPVLWYIIDRSKSGFFLSSAVGATGTALVLASYPDMLLRPESPRRNSTMGHETMPADLGLGFDRIIGRESLEGGIWILSVLFCSCVCFGNIGRRLALNRVMEQVVSGTDQKKSFNFEK